MKKLVTMLLLILMLPAHAFYLMASPVPRYTGDKIIVNIVGSDCDNIGMTAEEVRKFAQDSLDRFWNSASGTTIQFKVEGTITAPSDLIIDELVEYVPKNEILIGCTTNDDAFSSQYTLASGGIQAGEDGIPQGVVILNNTTTSVFPDMDRNQQLAIFAHEFGHAIGIGHSDIEYALMYYAVTETTIRTSLAEDDEDAISYLYPHESKAMGLVGTCATIATTDDDDNFPQGPFLASFILGVLMIFLGKIFIKERSKIFI